MRQGGSGDGLKTWSRNWRPRVGKRRPWTAQDLEYVKAHYANTSTAKIAAALKRNISCIYNQAFLLGVKKSPDFDAGPESGNCVSAIRPGDQPGRRRPALYGTFPFLN